MTDDGRVTPGRLAPPGTRGRAVGERPAAGRADAENSAGLSPDYAALAAMLAAALRSAGLPAGPHRGERPPGAPAPVPGPPRRRPAARAARPVRGRAAHGRTLRTGVH